uniref:Uncharacterized protein n=1 Tax=Aphis glycines nege-like virus 1 iso 1 TaxID=2961855 RepID=A0A976RY53_9VIRU|nr:hypothetical protein 4 [Aphis glycines nege-like virus 1 iso 1]
MENHEIRFPPGTQLLDLDVDFTLIIGNFLANLGVPPQFHRSIIVTMRRDFENSTDFSFRLRSVYSLHLQLCSSCTSNFIPFPSSSLCECVEVFDGFISDLW